MKSLIFSYSLASVTIDTTESQENVVITYLLQCGLDSQYVMLSMFMLIMCIFCNCYMIYMDEWEKRIIVFACYLACGVSNKGKMGFWAFCKLSQLLGYRRTSFQYGTSERWLAMFAFWRYDFLLVGCPCTWWDGCMGLHTFRASPLWFCSVRSIFDQWEWLLLYSGYSTHGVFREYEQQEILPPNEHME